MEAYITPGTPRGDRKRVRWGKGNAQEEGGDDVAGGGAFTHMTMLAETTEGMHNLFRLSSMSSMEGYYYKPRADRELLERYAKGLIVTTGCPSGAVQTRLRLGQYDEARREAAELQDIFGRDNVFLELMDHDLAIEKRVRDDLLRLGKELGIRPIATNDSHYTHPDDAGAHEALLCVQSGSTLSEAPYSQGGKRFAFEGNGYYVKSADEMRSLWEDKHGLSEACDNTLLIAERCEVDFVEEEGRYMARADLPDGHTEESWFVEEVWRGVHARYGADLSDEVRQRDRARDRRHPAEGLLRLLPRGRRLHHVGQGQRHPGRSWPWLRRRARLRPMRCASPICARLEHGLIFERFLNPERPSMPDFDIDFDERRRGEVIQYVSNKYGSDRVAQIATFGRLKAKAAVKDASRVLDFPFVMGEKITKALPADVMGKGVSLRELFNDKNDRYNDAKAFRELHDGDAEVRKVYETALGLEGQIRNWGVHAAGVIMSSEPLLDIVPIMRREQDGAIITQFDYPMCEALGLVKMDFLGLRNLTVLDDAVDNIKANRGIDLVLEDLPFDDPDTYALLSRGDTLGVFQLDGGPMRQLLRLMQPDNFEDISAVIALYRPGPMGADSHTNYAKRKNGKQPIDYIHPELTEVLKPILGTTYGLIVYQEQVMSIAQEVAGYSLGQADNLRRAMGKKKKEVLEKEFEGFQAGMVARGFSAAAVKKLWDILVPFADYAFNKAHSASYGVLSYWTAYLKAHYPAEFMAALLTSVKGDKDKSAIYLNECRRAGISVLVPDVNESMSNFTSIGDDIRFGMSAVRNVGENVVAGVVAARDEHGPFTDFSDFLDKVPLPVCNKRVLDSLIKAGGFDSLGHKRRALAAIADDAVDQYVDLKRNAAIGQDSLFGGLDETGGFNGITISIPEMQEWEKTQLLAFERDMLGLYVSDHPLLGMEHVIKANSDCTIGQLIADTERPDGTTLRLCGLVTSVVRRVSRKGDTWATVTIEDLEGSVDVNVFPGAYQSAAHSLLQDAIVVVRARMRRSDGEGVDVSALDVTVPKMAVAAATGQPLVVSLPVARCTGETIASFKQVLGGHPGRTPVHLRLIGPEDVKVMKLDDSLRIDHSSALVADLKELLGPQCLG